MYHSKQLVIALILVIGLAFGSSFAQRQVKSTGIGIRGSYYNTGEQEMKFVSYIHDEYAHVSNFGAGGSIFLFSRFEDHFLVEFTVGGMARVNSERPSFHREETEVFSAVPILVGIKYEFLSPNSSSNLRPYVSAGPGAYIVSDIHTVRIFGVEKGEVITRVNGGAHAGAGFNFFFTEVFGINFETKYHLVDFSTSHDRSGFEMGFGFVFTWGDYNSNKYQVPVSIMN